MMAIVDHGLGGVEDAGPKHPTASVSHGHKVSLLLVESTLCHWWGMKDPAEPSCRARAAELDILKSYFCQS